MGTVDSEAAAGGSGEIAAKAGQNVVGQDGAGIPIRPALRESKGAWASVGGELHQDTPMLLRYAAHQAIATGLIRWERCINASLSSGHARGDGGHVVVRQIATKGKQCHHRPSNAKAPTPVAGCWLPSRWWCDAGGGLVGVVFTSEKPTALGCGRGCRLLTLLGKDAAWQCANGDILRSGELWLGWWPPHLTLGHSRRLRD